MIYEYRCPQGHARDLQRKVSERDDPVTCDCGQAMKRAVSVSNFALKGEGWYADGYTKPAPKIGSD